MALNLTLRTLRLEDERSFLGAVEEFRRDEPPWEFALGMDRCRDFADYVRKCDEWARGENLPGTFVPATFFVGIVGNEVVGRVSVRHRLNDFLSRVGGHIGYGVRPSERRKGHATEMLRQSLPYCIRLGLTKVLLTCDADNLASRKVIETCGGIFESRANEPDASTAKLRYWIILG